MFLLNEFKNKTVLITGATGNLGKLLSNTFFEHNANLILIDRSLHELKKLEKNLIKTDQKNNISIFSCDMSKFKNRERVISKIKNSFNKIDIFINNAAVTGNLQSKGWNTDFVNQDISLWNKVFEVNLYSIFQFTQMLNSLLINSNSCSIINISSIYSKLAPSFEIYKNTKINNPAAYSASKAALNNLTKWLASRLSPNIRVNAICPGGIKANQDKNFIKKISKKIPLNRLANPEEVINVILFLASSYSSYINGQLINVDGGMSIFQN